MKSITSIHNPIIKTVIELKTKASKRKQYNSCVIEGLKEIEIAIESGIEIQKLLILDSKWNEYAQRPMLIDIEEIMLCTQEVMEKIAIRDSTQSIVAIGSIQYQKLEEVVLSASPFVMILENVEKPGNLGALLRTSDAANVDVILCADMQTDIFNHNVIRNSLGCVFSKQVVHCTNQEAFDFCIHHNIDIYATYLHTEQYYYQSDFTKPTALVFGTENSGISDFWIEKSDALIKIPMLGKIDSMNVSNSASILLYEVVKQRLS